MFPRLIKYYLYLLMILTSPVRCHLSNDIADRNNVRNIQTVKPFKCQNHNIKIYTHLIRIGMENYKYINHPYPKLLQFDSIISCKEIV